MSQLRKINRRISARRSVARILQKSGGDPPIEHPSCTHLAVIRCLGQLSHPPAIRGAPRGAARSPAGRRSATRGNLGCNWQKKTRRRPHGDPPFAVGTLDGDPRVICRQPRHGKSSNGVRWETAGSSLEHRWIIAGHVNIISCDFHLERLVKQQWVIKIKVFII